MQSACNKTESGVSKFASVIRAYVFSVGVLIGGMLAASTASALNGFSYFITCATCATSSDFLGAASTQARQTQSSGLYIVTSQSTAETAYVQVTGQLQNVGDGDQRPVWRFQVTSTLLVDDSGNSLAGLSEASLESDFQSFDSLFYGTTRKSTIGEVSVPADLAPSWVNVGDALETLQAKISNLILMQYNNSQVPLGTVITAVFSDGSKAKFVKKLLNGTPMWTPIEGWDKNGNHYDAAGHPTGNPNTSGSGGGSGSVNLGGGTQYTAAFVGDCLYVTTVTYQGNYWGGEYHFAAC